MTEWCNRPLDRVYPVMFIDAIMVKVRDGQVTNRPVYVAIGVTVNGERDILGLWAGDGGEGAKFWLSVLTEIRNRGVQDVCIVVCDCEDDRARIPIWHLVSRSGKLTARHRGLQRKGPTRSDSAQASVPPNHRSINRDAWRCPSRWLRRRE
jgi:Transposase, Mutator family